MFSVKLMFKIFNYNIKYIINRCTIINIIAIGNTYHKGILYLLLIKSYILIMHSKPYAIINDIQNNDSINNSTISFKVISFII